MELFRRCHIWNLTIAKKSRSNVELLPDSQKWRFFATADSTTSVFHVTTKLSFKSYIHRAIHTSHKSFYNDFHLPCNSTMHGSAANTLPLAPYRLHPAVSRKAWLHHFYHSNPKCVNFKTNAFHSFASHADFVPEKFGAELNIDCSVCAGFDCTTIAGKIRSYKSEC